MGGGTSTKRRVVIVRGPTRAILVSSLFQDISCTRSDAGDPHTEIECRSSGFSRLDIAQHERDSIVARPGCVEYRSLTVG